MARLCPPWTPWHTPTSGHLHVHALRPASASAQTPLHTEASHSCPSVHPHSCHVLHNTATCDGHSFPACLPSECPQGAALCPRVFGAVPGLQQAWREAGEATAGALRALSHWSGLPRGRPAILALHPCPQVHWVLRLPSGTPIFHPQCQDELCAPIILWLQSLLFSKNLTSGAAIPHDCCLHLLNHRFHSEDSPWLSV